ncbi:MAG: CDP-diacylglycerol--serine O-phosphatidyltransferase [bacterium]
MTDKKQDKHRSRGIYLLPNLFTTAAMFGGFYAIIASQSGEFHKAAFAIFLSMLLDGVDGRVARMSNTQTEFGAQYDSLADLVSFGLAPSLVIYQWSLVHLNHIALGWAKLGWLAAFLYAAFAAMRLARFNTKLGTGDKRFFEGLPSPTAAALVAGFVWIGNDMGVQGESVAFLSFIITVAAGGLMVSKVVYFSFKEIDFMSTTSFYGALAVVLALMLLAFDPPKVLFGGFLAYTLSGPLTSFVRWRRKRKARGLPQ